MTCVTDIGFGLSVFSWSMQRHNSDKGRFHETTKINKINHRFILVRRLVMRSRGNIGDILADD